MACQEFLCRLGTVDIGHVDIHENQVRFEVSYLLQGFLSGRGLSDKTQAFCFGKEALGCSSRYDAIVYNEDPE